MARHANSVLCTSCLLLLVLFVLFPAGVGPRVFAESAQPTTGTLQAIQDAATLKVIRTVQERVEEIRGIRLPGPIPAYYLDSETLKRIVVREFEEQYPEQRRKGVEQFLKSLRLIPEDLDILKILLPLLDEQVGGLYDFRTKRLYVRQGFDIERSEIARMILAHEICHALQDYAFDLKSLGIETRDDDDFSLAGETVAEGDAMFLMTEYATCWLGPDVVNDIPALVAMDQNALMNTPHFIRQELLFPYIQGEAFVGQAVERGPQWRNRLLADPPKTTREVIHTEEYFGRRDSATSLTLLCPDFSSVIAPQGPVAPAAPEGYRKLETNRMGELGARLLLEERLGAGIAFEAAEGWHGDAYAVCSKDEKKWWFCWESVWDSPRDAAQFTGAWVTLWRSIGAEKKLGDPAAADQEFKTGGWTIVAHRVGKRVVLVWWN